MKARVQEENHPWMKGFTIATLISGIIVGYAALSLVGSISGSYDPASTGAAAFWTTLAAVALIWGPIWLLKKSHSFTRWSTLSDGQKLLGWLIIAVGFYAGLIVIAIIAAAKAELSRRD